MADGTAAELRTGAICLQRQHFRLPASFCRAGPLHVMCIPLPPGGDQRFISDTGPVLRCALMMDAISS